MKSDITEAKENGLTQTRDSLINHKKHGVFV